MHALLLLGQRGQALELHLQLLQHLPRLVPLLLCLVIFRSSGLLCPAFLPQLLLHLVPHLPGLVPLLLQFLLALLLHFLFLLPDLDLPVEGIVFQPVGLSVNIVFRV